MPVKTYSQERVIEWNQVNSHQTKLIEYIQMMNAIYIRNKDKGQANEVIWVDKMIK